MKYSRFFAKPKRKAYYIRMNVPTHHAVFNSPALERYCVLQCSSHTLIPRELRLELLNEVILESKKSWLTAEKNLAVRIQPEHLERVLNVIDMLRLEIVTKWDQIDSLANNPQETYNGALLHFLPCSYTIDTFEAKLLPLVNLSILLSRKERPFVWEHNMPPLVNQLTIEVEGHVTNLLWNPTPEFLQEPKFLEYKSLTNVSIEEMLTFNNSTFKIVLEQALDEMQSLYAWEIIGNLEDSVWESTTEAIPEDISAQISFWMVFIHSLGINMESERARELRIFLAFNQKDASSRNQIIDLMTSSDPLLEDLWIVPNLHQTTLF